MKSAVLISCWNEREGLLSFLDMLLHQIDLMKTEGVYSFKVFVADGGSKDGTLDELETRYAQLRVLRGNHKDNWVQGINMAWKEASVKGPDFYLLLASGIRLEEGALALMMENSQFLRHKALLSGTVTNAAGEIVAGGRTKGGKTVFPDPVIPVPCYNFDGAFVLIPKVVYSRIGSFDKLYSFGFAIYDYGVRAYKAGIPRVVAPGVLARTERDDKFPKWPDAARMLGGIHSLGAPARHRLMREFFVYYLRSEGFFSAVWRLTALQFRVFTSKR